MLNSQFGHYFVEYKLGMGGMAIVYCAYDSERGERVALKILLPHLVKDAEVQRRFWREAEVVSRLRHPHIVQLYDYGTINGCPFLAMEYLPQGSLAQRLRKASQINLKAVVRPLMQIADALDYAHAQGIIHRDIKLENILLRDNGEPAVADFGIAYVQDAARLTVRGKVTGTPTCMSPEQAIGQTDPDYRWDLYALAVMGYLLATGYYPFTAKTPVDLIHKHIDMTPPTPSAVNPALPPAIDEVLLKGLAKNPDERYTSARALVSAFQAALETASDSLMTFVQPAAANPIESRSLAFSAPAANKRQETLVLPSATLGLAEIELEAAQGGRTRR
jgi:serine/threonine-protein kinase